VDIVVDGEPPVPATEASVRAAFDPDGGFWDFVILSRGEGEFIQAGHWWFMGRKTDTTFWHAAFDAATAGLPDLGDDTRESDLHAVEFRDAAGQFGVHQVLPRAEVLPLFLAYLAGGEGWWAGLSWEPVAAE
jgi:hypothetical protein